MPCMECEDGKWKWGENGECRYETKEECEAAHPEEEDVASSPGGTMKTRQWYRMEISEGEPTDADIYIYDFIGDWIDHWINELWNEEITVTAKAFVDELNKLPDSVKALHVHVNSPGGDVFGAVAIANALRDQRASKGRTVDISIDGLAASAASIIIQAGDPIRMADNALVMIHNPWTVTVGEAKELRKDADDLDTIRGSIISTYQWHSELSNEEIGALMDASTWMEADEAIEKGFATEKVQGLKVAASIDPRAVRKLVIPEKYQHQVEAFLRKEEPTQGIIQAAAQAGVPLETMMADLEALRAKPGKNLQDLLPMDPGNVIKLEAAKPCQVLRVCREADCLDLAEELIENACPLEEVEARVKGEKQKRAAAKARADEIHARCAKANLAELADGYINGSMSLEDIGKHLGAITARLDSAVIDGSLGPDGDAKAKPRINVSEVYSTRNRLLSAGKKE